MGFDLTAPRECVPQVGSTLGGLRESVGFATSLPECVELVWDSAADANAASWSTLDNRCFAHSGVQGLEVCGPVQMARGPAAAEVDGNDLQEASTDEQCSALEYHVCSFAAGSRECNMFAFRSERRLEDVPVCRESELMFRLAVGDSLPAAATVSFVVTTKNPAVNPDLVHDFWIVEQYNPSAELVSSRSERSWAVIPVLAEVTVRLTGALKASRALSELTLSFLPTSNADRIRLVALGPFGFDLSSATALDTASIVAERETSFVIIHRTVVGRQRLEPPVVLGGVLLPEPGPTVFLVATLRDTFKADETLVVRDGSTFTVPGRLEVMHRELETAHSYRTVFRPRVGQLAVATFDLSFGTSVSAGEVLLVSAPPFLFSLDRPLDLRALAKGGKEVAGDALAASSPEVSEDGTVLRIRLLAPLAAGAAVRLRLQVIPGSLPQNNERWLFETSVETGDIAGGVLQTDSAGAAALPTNTNDAVTPGFELVHVVTLKIEVGRVAPRANANIDVIIDPGDTRPTILILYAPKGFVFPAASCMRGEVEADSHIVSCRRLGEQNTAELQLRGAGR